jgi:hypothetical protein
MDAFLYGHDGIDALTAGKHLLKIEIRPYLKTPEVKIGSLIASGTIILEVSQKDISEAQIAVQPIQPTVGGPSLLRNLIPE